MPSLFLTAKIVFSSETVCQVHFYLPLGSRPPQAAMIQLNPQLASNNDEHGPLMTNPTCPPPIAATAKYLRALSIRSLLCPLCHLTITKRYLTDGIQGRERRSNVRDIEWSGGDQVHGEVFFDPEA